MARSMRYPKRTSHWVAVLVAGALISATLAAAPDTPGASAAAAFTVSSPLDTGDASPGDGACDDGAGRCTLRAAVEEANLLPGADTIDLPAGVYTRSSPMSVTDDLIIMGAGSLTTTLTDPTGSSEGFQLVPGVSLAVSGVTFSNGSDCIIVRDDPAITASTSIRIDDVVFDQCDYPVLLSSFGPGDVTMTRSDITGARYGVLIDAIGGSLAMDASVITETYYDAVLADFNAGDGSVDITGSSISNNLGNGVDVYNAAGFFSAVTVTGSQIDDNSGGFGLQTVAGRGPVTIRDSSLSRNYYYGWEGGGPAIIERSTFSGNRVEGIGFFGGGDLTVSDSTFAGNDTGVGLWGSGAFSSRIVNSTLSGNYVGVDSDSGSTEIVNSTIVGGPNLGLKLGYSAGAATVVNTIVHGNFVDCAVQAGGSQVTTLGHNIDGDGTCGFTGPGDQTGVDPLVGPLADNGGQTLTHALLDGSPAIDRGDDGACPPLDQRGTARPADGDGVGGAVCDIGAFEVVGGGGGTPGEVGVAWWASLTSRRLVALGAPIEITATGDSGGSATAQVAVRSWYPNADPGSPMLSAPEAALVDVALIGTGTPGTYVGTLDPLGLVEVISIAATVTTAAGSAERTTTQGLPVSVAGQVVTSVDLTLPAGVTLTPQLSITNTSTRDGDVASVASYDVHVSDLAQAPGYRVTVLGWDNAELVDPIAVDVRAGLVSAVEVVGAPVLEVPFTVEVLGFGGQPLPGALVSVVDSTGDEAIRQRTDDVGRVSGVVLGTDVQIHVDPRDQVHSAASTSTRLTEPDQIVSIPLDVIAPAARVSGVVTSTTTGLPVPGVDVFATSLVGDRPVSARTLTKGDGSYSIDLVRGALEIAAGNAFVGRGVSVSGYALTGDATIDLALDPADYVDLTVDLQTQYAGDSAPTPVDLDVGGYGYHLRVQGETGGTGFPIRENQVVGLRVWSGDDIEVCADGFEVGLSAACTRVVPSNGAATASLVLTQAARLTATLAAPGGVAPARWRASANSLQTQTGAGAEVSVGFPEPGDYDVVISTAEGWVRVEVSVADGDVIDLGTLQLGQGGLFANSSQTSVNLSPERVSPGDWVTARVAAYNGGVVDATSTVLSLEVPADTVPLTQSVLLNGQPIPSGDVTFLSGSLVVDIGTIPAGQSATVRATFAVQPGATHDHIGITAELEYGAGGGIENELLGQDFAAVDVVTLNAPRIGRSRTLALGGRAPAGSAITVLADGAPLATADTNARGRWNVVTTIPETPLPRDWTFVAVADTLPEPVTSASANFRWDPDYNDLLGIAMIPEGNQARVDIPVGSGQQPNFTMVWAPNTGYDARLQFRDPTRIVNASVKIGTAPTWDAAWGCKAQVADPYRCAYSAFAAPSANQVGAIRVDWESVASLQDISPDPLPPALTVDEVRSQLRGPAKTFTGLVVDESNPGETLVSALFPDLDNAGLDVRVTSTPANHTVTPEDLALIRATGIPLYGVSLSTRVDEATGTAIITAFIPDSDIAVPAGISGIRGLAALPVPGGFGAGTKLTGQALELALEGKLLGEGVEEFVKVGNALAGAGGDVSAYVDAVLKLGLSDQLLVALDWASSCTPEVFAQYQPRLDQIDQNLKVQFGMSVGLTVLGLATGPVGGVLLTLVSYGLDQHIAAIISGQISGILQEIAANPDCKPKPLPLQSPNEEQSPIADPVWIFDPSGYVFDLFEDNRVEGVTATLQSALSPSGPWVVWDSDWFGQQNPQSTGPDGSYAWDVPEGWWRVRFDKPGYATTFTDPLEVLPPHFDVNVEMTSRRAPAVAAVMAEDGDTYVDLTFDNYVLSTWIADATVTVLDGAGAELPISISPLDERVTAAGDLVARAFRLDTGTPFVVGDTYRISLAGAIQSHARVPLGSTTNVPFTVDPTGGVPVNQPPTATDDAYVITEGGDLVVAAPGVLANDGDPHGDPIMVTDFSGAANGTVVVSADGSLTYTPDASFCGSDSFDYVIADDEGLSAAATVHVDVSCRNDSPFAGDDEYVALTEMALAVSAARGVLANDFDLEGEALAVTSFQAVSGGGATVEVTSQGGFSYLPPPGLCGLDSFTYDVSDGVSASATGTVSVRVRCPDIALDAVTVGPGGVEGDGVLVTEGADLTWIYRVTNPGNVALSGLVVDDSQLGPVAGPTSGDDGNGLLDPGETWTFSASGVAGANGYQNSASVTADSVSDDSDTPRVLVPAAADSSSHLVGAPETSVDEMSLVVTGGVALGVSGPLLSGDFLVERDSRGVTGLQGTGVVGQTTVTANVSRWGRFPIYYGSIMVADPSIGGAITLAVLGRSLSDQDDGSVSLEAVGLSRVDGEWRLVRVQLVVIDRG